MSAMASQITSLTIVLLNRLFGRRSKKTPKLRVTGLCEGNSPVTGEFPSQMASNAENVSIWWRHHVWRPRHQSAPRRSDIDCIYSSTFISHQAFMTMIDAIIHVGLAVKESTKASKSA